MDTRLPASTLRRFLLTAGALYLVWFFGYEQWLLGVGQPDAFLTENITYASASALRGLGFDAVAKSEHLITISEQPTIWVGNPCNGLVLYALFMGFVLAFPGAWKRKLVFIPVGIVLIYLLNLARVVALAINHHYSRHTVDFNHHYTFTFVVYGCIFLLWVLWVRRFATPVQPLAHA